MDGINLDLRGTSLTVDPEGGASEVEYVAVQSNGQEVQLRPTTAPPRFVTRGSGGGGGAGGGQRGLGGRHAPRGAEGLPRTCRPISDEANRYVATRPPKSAAPKAGAFRERKSPPTNFRLMYDRGDLPLRVANGVAKYVFWHIPDLPRSAYRQLPTARAAGGPEYEVAKVQFLMQLDYQVYLPLFFEGLREQGEPYRFLAQQGTKDLIQSADFHKIAPVIPLLVLPLRLALNTREISTVRRAIEVIRLLIKVPRDPQSGQTIGFLLAPYFRHFLPIFNLFKSSPKYAIGLDDYTTSLGELMDETLYLMARAGGPGTEKEINRLVPLYNLTARTRAP